MGLCRFWAFGLFDARLFPLGQNYGKMSAILAVCGTAFCAMVSDGRMVEEPITDGKIKVLTDALPKVRKLNRNVLVGFAGDAVAAAQIINKLDEYDVQYMTLEKAVKVLQQAAQQTPCAGCWWAAAAAREISSW